MKNIPFIKPNFPEPHYIVGDLERIYANNFYSNNGPIYFEFKDALEKYLGRGMKAVVVNNATSALLILIRAVFGSQVNNKKYIAIPSFTFAAGPLAIKWCGFEPIFFDIDAKTAQPSIASFENVLKIYEKDLAGVVLVNNFGIGNREIDKWGSLLDAHNLKYIIDSAPGFGSTYDNGEPLGGKGVGEVFSFHATKPFAIGEGGLITTRDETLASRLEELKNFGFDDHKQTIDLGINAKITELDCAIGLQVIRVYGEVLKDRRNSYNKYVDILRVNSGIEFLPNANAAAIQFATIKVPAHKRQQVLGRLREGGVDAKTYYAPAVHTFPFFKSCPSVKMPDTEEISSRVISLPVHPRMDTKDIEYICKIVLKSLGDKT